MIFLNTFLNCNLFYSILVIFLMNFVHRNVQNFRYISSTGCRAASACFDTKVVKPVIIFKKKFVH